MPQDTELHKVAKEGDSESCTELLDAGANVDALGAQGRTALHRALAGGHDQCAGALLDRGADPTLADSMQRTSLVYACLAPEAEAAMRCVQLLFEKKGEEVVSVINKPTKSGTTPLHCATEKRAVDMVRLLLERGADATLQDGDGKSSIDMAKEAKLPKDLFDSGGGKEAKKGGFFGRRRASGKDEVTL